MNITRSVPRRNATALALVLGCACVALPGCAVTGYEKSWFASADVRVVHSQVHCKDAAAPVVAGTADADLVLSRIDGIGRLAATRTAWEVHARQLATELDADIAVIRPCDAESRAFESKQVELWRTRGHTPTVQEEPPAPGITFAAPAGTTYGTRLQHLYACLEQAYAAPGPLSSGDRARLPAGDASEFLSTGRHFAGYAKIDRHFRPTRAVGPSLSEPLREEVPRLSMTLSRRDFVDWAAGRYLALPANGRSRFAEHYVACLLDRGYRWEPVPS